MRKKIKRYNKKPHPALAQSTLPSILQRIYTHRGIENTEQIEHDLQNLLPYKYLLGIEEAVNILVSALHAQESILILGDYDVDGATSVALMIRVLRRFGAGKVDFIVPDRFTDGYGLTSEMAQVITRKKPDLLITVDNGINSCTGVDIANEHGIKVIITDHHLSGKTLPKAAAIINPNQQKDIFESKYLAGVGVAFYLLLALRTELRKQNWFKEKNIIEPNLANFLDLVALGTVADMMPLDKNNRVLIYQGLRRIRAKKCCAGVRALLTLAKRPIDKVISDDLVFAVSPRLNAAGRLDNMTLSVHCLLTDDLVEANKFAAQLNVLNEERKVIERNMEREAQGMLLSHGERVEGRRVEGICLFKDSWHQGVVGILASRVKDKFDCPVIVFASHNERQLKGSARSIKGINIRNVLANLTERYPGMVTKFGGHAMAAGLTIPKESYREFVKAFNQEVSESLNEERLDNYIMSDGELVEKELCIEVAELLRYSAPWGESFSYPVFDGDFHVLQQRLLSGNHLKLLLKKGEVFLDGIMFNADSNNWPNNRCERVQIAYHLETNEYRGQRKLQLRIIHIETK